MAVITATLKNATQNELVYTFTGTGADTGTIPYATLVADALAPTAAGARNLESILVAVGGECNSTPKAISALITGEAFTGTSGKVSTTNIEVKLVAGTAAAIPFVTAAAPTASNPEINFGTAGVGQCFLYIKHVHSVVQ